MEGETLDYRADFVIQAGSANGPGIPAETWDNRWGGRESEKNLTSVIAVQRVPDE